MSNDIEWRDVTTHGGKWIGRYQVSNTGLVRAHPEAAIGGMKRGRILFQGADERGYPQVELRFKRTRTTVKVHRLVADAFLGFRPCGWTVNHVDGDKKNNNVNNLEFVSRKENTRHAHRVISGRSHVLVCGQRMSIPEAVEKHAVAGVNAQMVRRRIRRYGWSIYEALKTAPQPTGHPTKQYLETRKSIAAKGRSI